MRGIGLNKTYQQMLKNSQMSAKLLSGFEIMQSSVWTKGPTPPRTSNTQSVNETKNSGKDQCDGDLGSRSQTLRALWPEPTSTV
eukprot:6293605-Amphidinium_carterae.1